MTRVLFVILLLFAASVSAVTLEDLVVKSLPGQPLKAVIPVNLQDTPLASLKLRLASAGEYASQGISYHNALQELKIALLDMGHGRARVEVFGSKPWQGEEVILLLQLDWPRGEIQQHFRISAVLPEAEPSVPVYIEVQKDETLDQIAIRANKGRNRSYLHMMYALFKANPDAFYQGNMNNLKRGQHLRIPNDEELYHLSDREVYTGIREQERHWRELRERKQTDKDAPANGLNESLEQQLRRLSSESEQAQQENRALRQRLQQVEQRMLQMTEQVLDYAAQPIESPVVPAATPSPQVAAEEPLVAPESKLESEIGQDLPVSPPPVEQEEELSLSTVLAAAVMVLLFGFYIVYSVGHPHRGRS